MATAVAHRNVDRCSQLCFSWMQEPTAEAREARSMSAPSNAISSTNLACPTRLARPNAANRPGGQVRPGSEVRPSSEVRLGTEVRLGAVMLGLLKRYGFTDEEIEAALAPVVTSKA